MPEPETPAWDKTHAIDSRRSASSHLQPSAPRHRTLNRRQAGYKPTDSLQYGGGVSIRVVVADDAALFREGLAQLAARAEGLELVGTASDLPSVLDLVERMRPDVVVTDIRMPPTQTNEGIQLATRLRAEQPDIGVIVLSQHTDPAYTMALLDGGVSRRGCFSRNGWLG